MVIFLKKEQLLNSLSLTSKANLFVGSDFWRLDPIDGYQITTSDGPHGLRKEVKIKNKIKTLEAVCFPPSCLSSSCFDENLMYLYGQELAKACIHNNVDIILGPGVNIKRDPRCGRNFEYFSEDPFLSGTLSASYINGVQSKNIGVCLKHYALNSQEDCRFINDSIVDERAMREIYLKSFEIAITKSSPWSIMASYNKINGLHASENSYLLTDIGRNEFGFEGVYISDWGALVDPIESLKSGLDIEMPGTTKSSSYRIVQAIKNQKLDEEVLNQSTSRILDLLNKVKKNKVDDYNLDHSLDLARKVVEESCVLLKNDEQILPLKSDGKYALIGRFAKESRYQGGGSSHINSIFVDNLYDEFKKNDIDFEYADGYQIGKHKLNSKLIQTAKNASKGKDAVILVIGLEEEMECEGFDRVDLHLPESHIELLKEIYQVNKNIVVILEHGGVVYFDYLKYAKGILDVRLGGSKLNEGLVNILLGKVNPSGRLSETYPLENHLSPTSIYYHQNKYFSLYKESIYVGYRYYDTFKVPVLFPFGYGLSYSEVIYSNLCADLKDDNVILKMKVTNQSDIATKEVVQFYVGQIESKIFKARKELKGFKKITLGPKETKEVEILISKDDLRYYSINQKKWILESGIYRFYASKNVSDESLFVDLKIRSNDQCDNLDNVPSVYYSMNKEISNQEFFSLLGYVPNLKKKIKPLTIDSPISDFTKTVLGFIILKLVIFFTIRFAKKKDRLMLKKVIPNQPIRSLRVTHKMTLENIEGLVDIFNYHLFKGIKKLLSKKERI